MLRGRQRSARSYWAVALWLFCYSGFISTSMVGGLANCSYESTTEVTKVIKIVKSMTTFDCRLYTPTLQAVKKCPVASLKCFSLEAKVLRWESESELPNLSKRIRLLSETMSDRNDRACPQQCEVHAEMAAVMFLQRLLLVLQWVNGQSCDERTTSVAVYGQREKKRPLLLNMYRTSQGKSEGNGISKGNRTSGGNRTSRGTSGGNRTSRGTSEATGPQGATGPGTTH